MSRLRQLNFIVLAALASAWPWVTQAAEIYHWVDAEGVPHFSQTAPPQAVDEVKTLEIDGSQPAGYDPNEDIYNVAAQAEATQAVYDKLAENRKARQKEQSTAQNTVIYYPEPDAYNQIRYPPVYRPRPPDRPPDPRPPESRPPNGSLLPDPPELAPAVPSTRFQP